MYIEWFLAFPHFFKRRRFEHFETSGFVNMDKLF